MSTFDAWAAGFFDGEGTVGVYQQYTTKRDGVEMPQYGIQMSVVQVDPAPLVALAGHYGGRVSVHKTSSRQGRERPKHTWRAGSKMAIERFLVAIRPYSIAKARQIDLALEFLDTLRAGSGRQYGTLTPDQIATRERVARELRAEKWATYDLVSSASTVNENAVVYR